jgi:vacuolar iron transporter family protein
LIRFLFSIFKTGYKTIMTTNISNIVYGGIDGTVTTFAVMAASIGSGLTGMTVAILALANVFADGFSMGVSSYESVIDESEDPIRKAIITFIAFVAIGMIPVIAYYTVRDEDYDTKFNTTVVASLMTLFLIGSFKGYASEESVIKSGLKTTILGGAAGAIAYYVAINLSEYGKDRSN